MLIKKGEITNKAYRARAHEVKTLVAQFQKVIEKKDKAMEEKGECLQS